MQKIQFSATASSTLNHFDSLIVAVDADGNLISNDLTDKIQIQNLISQLHQSGDFTGKTGSCLMLSMPKDVDVQRLFLVGLGDTDKLSDKAYLGALQNAAKQVLASGCDQLLNGLAEVAPKGRNSDWSARQNALIFQKSFYQYTHPSRGTFSNETPKLNAMSFTVNAAQESLSLAQATALGMELTQDLANMPPNYCTPSYLAQTAQELANTYGFKAHILEREQMQEMGMGSFMAVAQGSATPPKMICIEYNGGGDEAPIALVGKGVTFDTGGISLKPGESMDEMKYDMGGAATVLGVFKALGELKPKINVVAVIPSTENMPGGKAAKPGDVVTSLSGQTIEILNTDAEGRLILCDALTYAQQTYKPSKVIDMATLTGACIIALGNHVSGILGNDQSLVDQIRAAGEETYDRLWQLPLGEEWDEQLKSNFADMANIGGRAGGTITAAQFLARFTKEVPWAHLDIAGTAWVSGKDKGASGRPVPAMIEFLNQQAKS
ncbi:leucyl aminopeptidase [Thiomicrorhabdus sp. 6S3-12]|uniref:leucyl aminopeptidase n=1 Tax=Thiomicrorhabdus sp. 6S3-12 TaxID=2819681 RepID=UPI001AAD9570|nr:leucyl aminopeptidase [Thiomicrorhabdus sp. 6S3-12]MBO1923036.1 leucyl aminopeptidase [Thiomicrorhabdus sp. 6S3-12]